MNTKHRASFAAELKNLAAIRRHVEKAATTLGIDAEIISGLVLAVDEAACNIIVHGYAGKPGTIEIEMERDAAQLVIRLRDHAPPFDPTRVPSPDCTLPLDQREIGGMGVHLMRQVTDELRHRVLPEGGNELTMVIRTTHHAIREENHANPTTNH